MTTVRLNKKIKKMIKTRLIEKAFGNRQNALKNAQFKFGDKVYNDVYSLKEQKDMNAMPDGFMKMDTSLVVRFLGRPTHIYFNRRPIAYKHTYACAKPYNTYNTLFDEWDELCNTENQLKTEMSEAVVSIDAVLDKVATLKQLLEIWPEAEPWFNDFVSPSVNKNNSPALLVSELNKNLGLGK